MNEARLEAFMLTVLEDIAERRTPDQLSKFADRLAVMARFIDEQAFPVELGQEPAKVAAEMRAIERFLSRHPRLEP